MIYLGPFSKSHYFTLRCNAFIIYTYRSVSNYLLVSAGDTQFYNNQTQYN